MVKDVAKRNFIKLYFSLLEKQAIGSQKEFAKRLGVTPQALGTVLDKNSKRSVSDRLQAASIREFNLDENYFSKPIENSKDVSNSIGNRMTAAELAEFVNNAVKPYQAQIDLLKEKIERLQNDKNQ